MQSKYRDDRIGKYIGNTPTWHGIYNQNTTEIPANELENKTVTPTEKWIQVIKKRKSKYPWSTWRDAIMF